VATLGRRHAEPIERLGDAGAAGRWLVLAGVLPQEAKPKVSAAQLDALRDLREAIHRLVRAAKAGRALDARDVATLNVAAARRDLAPQLVSRGTGAALWEGRNPIDAALASIARDAVLLLTRAPFDRIKECENDNCSLVFLDESQSGRRRWCSMERCGNLAKIHKYRRRSKS